MRGKQEQHAESTRKMKPFSSSFFPLAFCLFLLFFTHGVAGQDLINKTCHLCAEGDPNIKFGFCKSSLQAAPASQCASLRGLGMISIRLIRYNVTDTRCHIKNLLKDKKLDGFAKEYLSDCLELFSDAIYSVKKAMKSYNSKRYDDANIEISSVADAATTCEDGFQERRGLVSPLTKRNNDTFQLSALALSIMNLLHTGSD